MEPGSQRYTAWPPEACIDFVQIMTLVNSFAMATLFFVVIFMAIIDSYLLALTPRHAS